MYTTSAHLIQSSALILLFHLKYFNKKTVLITVNLCFLFFLFACGFFYLLLKYCKVFDCNFTSCVLFNIPYKVKIF